MAQTHASQLPVNVVILTGQSMQKMGIYCASKVSRNHSSYSPAFYIPCLNPCNIRAESLRNYYLMCISLLFSSITIPCQQWLLLTPIYSVSQKESHQWCALSGSNLHISLPSKEKRNEMAASSSSSSSSPIYYDLSAFHGAGLILLPTFP